MASFDFGTYSEATGEPPSKKLSWRDDPEESLSDWTIVVSSAGEESTFHVHKAMLAAHHAQQSDYFKSEFAGSVSSLFMASSNRTRLDLEDSAAAAFPAYLDFVYTGELAVTSESATALLHLAGSLRCHQLHNVVTQFMQDDLCGKNAALYLAEAERYSLEKVAAAALSACASHWRIALVPTIRAAAAGNEEPPKESDADADADAAPPSPLGRMIPEATQLKVLADALKVADDEMRALEAKASQMQDRLRRYEYADGSFVRPSGEEPVDEPRTP